MAGATNGLHATPAKASNRIGKKQSLVMDMGCGMGALLSVLVYPAPFLDTFPVDLAELASSLPAPLSLSPVSLVHQPVDMEYRRLQLAKLSRLRDVVETERELHLSRIVGIDLRTESVEQAIANTDPLQDTGAMRDTERWTGLSIELWQGDASVRNAAFDGIQGIVSSEVIEHLPADILPIYSQTMFDYNPEMIVVTTPNYSFNAYFVAQSAEEAAVHRFADPTGRTDRVFRDDDHQFEFTQDEFELWANELAERNDYSVEFTGVGSLASYYRVPSHHSSNVSLPAHSLSIDSSPSLTFPSIPSRFFATQIAIFHRSAAALPHALLKLSSIESTKAPHALQKIHHYPISSAPALASSSSTYLPPSPSAASILPFLAAIGQYYNALSLSLSVLWSTPTDAGRSLRFLCRGRIVGLLLLLIGEMERLRCDEREWEIELRDEAGEKVGGEVGIGVGAVVIRWARWEQAVRWQDESEEKCVKPEEQAVQVDEADGQLPDDPLW